MPYLKTIVCFANSRKLSARCIAGRELTNKGFGAWLRPVSGGRTGEIAAQRLCIVGGQWRDPQLLDLISIPLIQPVPSGYQTENHLIDAAKRWEFQGTITFAQALGAIEQINGPLWVNGHSTYNGLNDKIPAPVATALPNSLMLIQPQNLEMVYGVEGAAFGTPRSRVRGHFTLAGHNYVLMVTDPVVEAEFRGKAEGSRRTAVNPLLCISISEVLERQNACYKLIAGVIEAVQKK